MILCIIIPVYIIGVIVTTLICYKLDIDDENAIWVAWFWPTCLALTIIIGILWLPVGIYKLLENKSNKSSDYDHFEDE
jgi:ABC-type branched-subunit amino acid transport system permease subunit